MISASGIPHIIKASWIKENAVCIDVGISPIIGIDRKPGITGDFEFIQVVFWFNKKGMEKCEVGYACSRRFGSYNCLSDDAELGQCLGGTEDGR